MNYIKILERQEKLISNEIKEQEIIILNKIRNIYPQNLNDPIGEYSKKISHIFSFTIGVKYGYSIFNAIKNIITKN